MSSDSVNFEIRSMRNSKSLWLGSYWMGSYPITFTDFECLDEFSTVLSPDSFANLPGKKQQTLISSKTPQIRQHFF